MAVPEQTPYKEYTANGVTTSFPLEFDCENQDHLIVTVNDIEPENGQWSLINGAVVFLIAPANQAKIVIQRNTPLERNTNYQTTNNSFRPQPVNKDFDRIWWKLQELGYRDQVIWLALVKEVADRVNGDKKLQDQINTIDQQVQENTSDIAQLVDDLSQEIADRITNDKILKDMFLAIVDTAINEGTVNALAITHVDSLDELNAIKNVWEGRTVSVTGIGNYKYNATTQAWERDFITDRQVITVDSVADLSSLAKWGGRTVIVRSYYKPNFALAKPFRGSAYYTYVSSRSSENDGFSCINGWVQLIEDKLTFDACGVYVDDDTQRDFNTTRITALLTYAINNKKSVEAGVGRYCANTVSLDRVDFGSTAFNLVGQGRKSTIFDFSIALVSSSTTAGSTYSLRWQHAKFKDFFLNPTVPVDAALTLQRVGMIYVDDADISYAGTGLRLWGGSEVFFKNCDIYSCYRGLYLHSMTNGTDGGIDIDLAVVSFDNCNISNCTKHEIYKARSLYFNGGNFNANQSDSAYFYDSQLISFKDVSIESSKNFVFTNCSNIQLDKSLMGLVASDKFVLINSTVTDNASVWEGGSAQIKLDATSQYISKSIAIYYPTFNVDHTNANLSNITFDFLPQNSMLLSNSIFTRKSHYPIIMNSANYTFSNSNPNYLKTGTYYIECTGGVVMLIPINSDFAGFEIIGKQIPVPELHTGSDSLGALGSRGVFVSVQSLGELRRYIYVPSPSFKNLITVGGQLYIAFSLFSGSVIDSIKVFTSSKAYSNVINKVTNFTSVSLAASAKSIVNYNVSGAAIGDLVKVSVYQDLTSISVRGWVSSDNTVSVEFANLTSVAVAISNVRVTVEVS